MTTSLQELKQKRLKWVEANRENGFEEGINRLLTELYPDNAHFIYELLQNAEDPKATEVRFQFNRIRQSSLNITANACLPSRMLNPLPALATAPSVTIRPAIGKFGVGFKAVFAYTDTPEIHSGDFHFRIHDFVVPETDGVSKPSVS